jgi:hypothetical protein
MPQLPVKRKISEKSASKPARDAAEHLAAEKPRSSDTVD